MNRSIKIIIFIGFICIGWWSTAQNSVNPFDLTPRLAPSSLPTQENEDKIKETPVESNPFDIKKGITPTPVEKKAIQKEPVKILPKETEIAPAMPGDRTFLFPVFMINLIVLTLLVTLFRSFLKKAYNAFLNDNLLNQVYRERETGTLLPYLFLYFVFFFNAGLYIFLSTRTYGPIFSIHPLIEMGFWVGIITLVFLAKHLLLNILGVIFPISKESKKYSFTIMIFGIILGLILVPLNLFIAYAPVNFAYYTVFISMGIIILIYLFLLLRGLFIANRFLRFHKFHFLLYICTVEIAPVFIIIKVIFNQML